MSGASRRRVAAAGLVLAALGALGWMLRASGGPHAPIGGPGASLAALGSQGSGAERALAPLAEDAQRSAAAGDDGRSSTPDTLDETERYWEDAMEAMGRFRVVGGVVRGPDGSAIEGVQVCVGPEVGRDAVVNLWRAADTDAAGRYWFQLGPGLLAACRVWVTLDRPSRFGHAEPASHTIATVTDAADFELVPLPAVRVRVVDAVDGRPIPEATAEGRYTERDGDALVLWLDGHVGSKRGTIGVGFGAPGYLPAQAWITPPEAGVATRDEPVALEPGVEVSGTLRKRVGAGLAGWIVAEPLDVDSVTPRLSGANTRDDGRWRLLLRPGRYRLLALVFGRPPLRGTLHAAPGVDPVAIEVAEPGEDLPAAPRFAWAQRRDLELPFVLPSMGFGGAERVIWLAEIADAPIAIDDDVTDRLAAATAPALRAGEPLYRALRETARAARVEADYLAGRVHAPR